MENNGKLVNYRYINETYTELAQKTSILQMGVMGLFITTGNGEELLFHG